MTYIYVVLTGAKFNLVAGFFLVFVLIATNVNNLLSPRLWGDAVPYFGSKITFSSPEVMEVLSNLRPAYGLVLILTSNLIDFGISASLFYLTAVFFNGLSAFLLADSLKKQGFSKTVCFISALGVITLPSFQNYTQDLVMWIFNPLIALIIFFYSRAQLNNRLTIWRLMPLCVLTVLVYQPLFGIILLLFFLRLLALQNRTETQVLDLRSTLKFLAYNFVALFLQVLVALIFATCLNRRFGIELSTRTELVSDLYEVKQKVVWIISVLVGTLLRPWFVSTATPSLIASFVISTTIIIVGLLRLRNSIAETKFILGIFPVLVLFSSNAPLVIEQNQFEFRAFPSLCLGGLIWLITLLDSALSSFKIVFLQQILVFTIAIVAFLTTLSSSYNLWTRPTEIRDELINRALDSNSKKYCQIIPEGTFALLNNLGIYSIKSDLTMSWVRENIIRVIAKDRSIRGIEVVEVRNAELCPPEFERVDFTILSK